MTTATMYSGDSTPIQVTVTDSETGAAVVLTGAAMTWALTRAPGTTPVLTKTSGAGEITVGGAGNNVATVTLGPTDTATLEGLFIHELQVTDGSGNVFTVFQQHLYIKGDVVT